MIDNVVNNYNINTISNEKCLPLVPVSICKIITHRKTKTTQHVYVTHNNV